MITIPGYKIERILGSGNMATVYLARHELLNRQVALKCMDETLSQTPGFIERFLSEGRIIASLQHPNILTTYDLGISTETNTPFLAMEYIKNGDLAERIKQGLTADQALEIIQQIAIGLDYAHVNGIIHRDIKPGNILFREDGTPLISDFGIAKQADMDQGLTSTGLVMGTPFYMSPEQAQDHPLDGRADIYSLGILLYEMLTGEVPYRSTSVIGTVLKHVQSPVPRLEGNNKPLQPLLDRLLAKEPSDRYSRGQSVADSIDKLHQGMPISNQPGDSIAFPKINITFFQRYKMFDFGIFTLILLLVLYLTYPENDQILEQNIKPEADIQKPVATKEDSTTTDSEPLNEHFFTLTESSPQSNKTTKISELLNKAEICILQKQLTQPVDNNAFYFYQQVLSLDANNPDALAGLKKISQLQ